MARQSADKVALKARRRSNGTFQRGSGGTRGNRGGGPTPQVIRQQARKLFVKYGLHRRMAQLAAGKLTYNVQIFSPEGKLVTTEKHPPRHSDQLAAAKFLATISELEPPPPAPMLNLNRPVLIVRSLAELPDDV